MSSSALEICEFCRRQLLENGQCLYCTTSEALELRAVAPLTQLQVPEPGSVLTLVDAQTGRRYPLEIPRTRIGRDRRNHIALSDDLYASHSHAFISFEDDAYWIEDLGSKNGTLLNGAHILDREQLRKGDVLTIGHSRFMIE